MYILNKRIINSSIKYPLRLIKSIYIYKITNPKGCIYIGKTQNVKKRIRQYILYSNKITQPKLQYSILKYGWDNHNFEVIETCLDTQSNVREIYWIKFYNSYHNINNNGLNLTLGGDGGSGRKIGKPKNKVEQRDCKTGDLIKLWDGGVGQIERELKFTNQSIYECINGHQSTAFGYVWCYEGKFNGIRQIRFKTPEYSKLRSDIWREKYDNGFINPSTGMVGSKNKRSKPIYCIELDMKFESILLAAKYFKEKYFQDKNIDSLHVYISNSANKKTKMKREFNFKFI